MLNGDQNLGQKVIEGRGSRNIVELGQEAIIALGDHESVAKHCDEKEDLIQVTMFLFKGADYLLKRP